MVYNEHITTLNFRYKNNQNFGGYATYWKLIKEYYIKSKIIKKSAWFKFKEFFNIEIYHRFLKPLKFFYSYKEKHEGYATYKITKAGEKIVEENIIRLKNCTLFKTFYLFRIPFAFYLRDMTDDEIKERFKK